MSDLKWVKELDFGEPIASWQCDPGLLTKLKEDRRANFVNSEINAFLSKTGLTYGDGERITMTLYRQKENSNA